MQVSQFNNHPNLWMRNNYFVEVASHCNSIKTTLAKIIALNVKLGKNESHLLHLQAKADHCRKGKSGRHKRVSLNTQITVHKEARAILFKSREKLEKTLGQQESNFRFFTAPTVSPPLPPQESFVYSPAPILQKLADEEYEIEIVCEQELEAIVEQELVLEESIPSIPSACLEAAFQECVVEEPIHAEKSEESVEESPQDLSTSLMDNDELNEAFRVPTPSNDDEMDIETQEGDVEELQAMLLELEEINDAIKLKKNPSSGDKKKAKIEHEVDPADLAISILTNKIEQLLDKQERKTNK